MTLLKFLWSWARRLPPRFTVVFVAFMLLYLVAASAVVRAVGVATLGDLFWRALTFVGVPAFLGTLPIVRVFWEGLVVVFILFLGVLVGYNLAAWVYRGIRRRPRLAVHAPAEDGPGSGGRLDRFEKIGIILAGGGAKGAYQAGALKAIHEFVEKHGALHKVRMVAGTSIGSWNAMFWLGGMVKPREPGGRSLHEEWWRTIGVDRIVEFAAYWPLARNYFLRPTPWRETFRRIFVETPEVQERLARLFAAPDGNPDPSIHFYFTRSNVTTGRLEFATNWPGLPKLTRQNMRTADPNDREPVVKRGLYELIDGADLGDALSRTERAVFASMDLPPLFSYVRIRGDEEEWFEDGGVVENIPVWFGVQIEQCDLLFILPLNASFAESVDHRSVTKRLFRVMDVRQGVLERNALKLAYLYNELAALRAAAAGAGAPAEGERRAAQQDLRATALARQHKPVSVFAICPEQPLTIGTQEFWKPAEAGRAFDLMYAATKYELDERFEEDTNPNWIRMTLVNQHGERTHFDDF